MAAACSPSQGNGGGRVCSTANAWFRCGISKSRLYPDWPWIIYRITSFTYLSFGGILPPPRLDCDVHHLLRNSDGAFRHLRFFRRVPGAPEQVPDVGSSCLGEL